MAAGLVPFAQGSDGGGSVRIPASVCGLFGIKVARGRVSNGPVLGDVTGLAWNGPLARSVRDAAAMLDAMAVPMPGDPYWAPPLSGGETFLSYAGRDPGTLRIGRYATPAVEGAEVHPDCLAAYEAATEALTGLGHEVEDDRRARSRPRRSACSRPSGACRRAGRAGRPGPGGRAACR